MPAGLGTEWKPEEKYLALYAAFIESRGICDEAAAFLQSRAFSFSDAAKEGNLRAYLNKRLKEEGYAGAEVLMILKTGAGANADMADKAGIVTLAPDESNGHIDADKLAGAEQGDFAYLAQVIVKYGGGAYAQRTTGDTGVVLTVE
jgi:hypothetical protein